MKKEVRSGIPFSFKSIDTQGGPKKDEEKAFAKTKFVGLEISFI
jgi:hypothetical protein